MVCFFFLVHEREGFFYRLAAKCYYLIHVQRRVVFKNNTTQCDFKTFCRWILGVFIHPVLIFFLNNVSFDIEFIVLQKLMYLISTVLWFLIIIISASSEQKKMWLNELMLTLTPIKIKQLFASISFNWKYDTYFCLLHCINNYEYLHSFRRFKI